MNRNSAQNALGHRPADHSAPALRANRNVVDLSQLDLSDVDLNDLDQNDSDQTGLASIAVARAADLRMQARSALGLQPVDLRAPNRRANFDVQALSELDQTDLDQNELDQNVLAPVAVPPAADPHMQARNAAGLQPEDHPAPALRVNRNVPALSDMDRNDLAPIALDQAAVPHMQARSAADLQPADPRAPALRVDQNGLAPIAVDRAAVPHMQARSAADLREVDQDVPQVARQVVPPIVAVVQLVPEQVPGMRRSTKTEPRHGPHPVAAQHWRPSRPTWHHNQSL